jgi:hypothetical protein
VLRVLRIDPDRVLIDVARLAGAYGLCGELKGATRVVPVRITMPEADAERLFSLIATALQAPRS